MYRARAFEPRSTTAGFTLIEVLVALAVVAASLAAIGSLVATTARGNRSIEQHVALVETARAVEASFPGRDQLAAGDQSGEMAGFAWRVHVAPLFAVDSNSAEPPRWLPQHVSVTVRAPSGAVLRIDTVRLQRRAN